MVVKCSACPCHTDVMVVTGDRALYLLLQTQRLLLSGLVSCCEHGETMQIGEHNAAHMGADCANSHVNPVSECRMNKTLMPRLAKAKPCVPTTEKSCSSSPGNQLDSRVLTKMCTCHLIAFSIILEVLSVEKSVRSPLMKICLTSTPSLLPTW